MSTELYFKKLKFKPNVLLELGSNEAIKEAVIGGLGVAVLSQHALGRSNTKGEIAVLDCREFPIETSWHIVSPKGKKLSPISKVFREHLRMNIQY